MTKQSNRDYTLMRFGLGPRIRQEFKLFFLWDSISGDFVISCACILIKTTHSGRNCGLKLKICLRWRDLNICIEKSMYPVTVLSIIVCWLEIDGSLLRGGWGGLKWQGPLGVLDGCYLRLITCYSHHDTIPGRRNFVKLTLNMLKERRACSRADMTIPDFRFFKHSKIPRGQY